MRIHNTDAPKIIVSRFESEAAAVDGYMALDGVSGICAPVRLEFMDPGRSRTGKLLFTARGHDVIEGIEALPIRLFRRRALDR